MQNIPGYGYKWERGAFLKGFSLPVDNGDFSTLQPGALRWNSVLDSVQVWNGDKWFSLGAGAGAGRPFGLGTGFAWSGVNKDTLTLGYRSFKELDLGKPTFDRDAGIFLIDTGQAHTFMYETRGLTTGGISSFVLDSTGIAFLSASQYRVPNQQYLYSWTPTSRIQFLNTPEPGRSSMTIEHISGHYEGDNDSSTWNLTYADRYGLQLKTHQVSLYNPNAAVRNGTMRILSNSLIDFGYTTTQGADTWRPINSLFRINNKIGIVEVLSPLVARGGFYAGLIHSGDKNYTVADGDYTIMLDKITASRTLTLPIVSPSIHGRILQIQLTPESGTPNQWNVWPAVYFNGDAQDVVYTSVVIQADGVSGKWLVVSN